MHQVHTHTFLARVILIEVKHEGKECMKRERGRGRNGEEERKRCTAPNINEQESDCRKLYMNNACE